MDRSIDRMIDIGILFIFIDIQIQIHVQMYTIVFRL